MIKLSEDVRYYIYTTPPNHESHQPYQPYQPHYNREKLIDMLKKIFFGGNERFNKLVDMLGRIKNDDNMLIILSNGYSHDIKWLLGMMGIEGYFDEVIGMMDEENKGNTKDYYLLIYSGILQNTYRYIFYVDDTHEYHNSFTSSSTFPITRNVCENCVFHSDTKQRHYIFYNGLKKDNMGMSIVDMETIEKYIISNPYINILEQNVSVNHTNSQRDEKYTYTRVSNIPASAPVHISVPTELLQNIKDDSDEDPFAEPEAEYNQRINSTLTGGRYYKLYKKNKNNNNRL